jgi:hypothetical protein
VWGFTGTGEWVRRGKYKEGDEGEEGPGEEMARRQEADEPLNSEAIEGKEDSREYKR